MQTWFKYKHINADFLTRVNHQFDVLIASLEIGNKEAIPSAAMAMNE